MKENEYIAILQQFDDYLDSKHLKHTEERHKVLEVICTFKGHFDVDMILDHLQKRRFTVSRATIYNTLEILIDADVVIRHPLNGNTQQYELCCLSTNHTHLVCTQCGSIRKISSQEQPIDPSIMRKNRFMPAYYCIYIYGQCAKCRQKQKGKDKKRNRIN